MPRLVRKSQIQTAESAIDTLDQNVSVDVFTLGTAAAVVLSLCRCNESFSHFVPLYLSLAVFLTIQLLRSSPPSGMTKSYGSSHSTAPGLANIEFKC